VAEAQLGYIEQSDLEGEYPIHVRMHDPVVGWPYRRVRVMKSWGDLHDFLVSNGSRCLVSYRYSNRVRWRHLKVGWWTKDSVLSRLARINPTQGEVDFEVVAKLAPEGVKLAAKYKVPISAPPKINDQGRPDRSDTWMWLAGIAVENGATNEEVGAIMLRCRRTFMDRFPRGLNDRHARKEIKRVCSKLRKKS
jgi:hypothetical protein